MTQHYTPHGLPSRATPKPPRAVCERIGREVAVSKALTFDALLNSCTTKAKDARSIAWARIVEEVGCSADALAKAWGVERTTIANGLSRAKRLELKGRV